MNRLLGDIILPWGYVWSDRLHTGKWAVSDKMSLAGTFHRYQSRRINGSQATLAGDINNVWLSKTQVEGIEALADQGDPVNFVWYERNPEFFTGEPKYQYKAVFQSRPFEFNKVLHNQNFWYGNIYLVLT